jgi:hypothetical protein
MPDGVAACTIMHQSHPTPLSQHANAHTASATAPRLHGGQVDLASQDQPFVSGVQRFLHHTLAMAR